MTFCSGTGPGDACAVVFRLRLRARLAWQSSYHPSVTRMQLRALLMLDASPWERSARSMAHDQRAACGVLLDACKLVPNSAIRTATVIQTSGTLNKINLPILMPPSEATRPTALPTA